jgi:Domain of unknown function (DUF4450)
MRQLSRTVGTLFMMVVVAATAGPIGRARLEDLVTPLYTVEGDALVRHNGDRFNNRPLYCNQLPAIVVAGDRPLLRFGSGSLQCGTFIVALARGGQVKWLFNGSDITAKYRPGRMEWVIRDASLGGSTVTLGAVPLENGVGMAVRAQIAGAQPGDQLVWVFGGARPLPKESMQSFWDVTTAGREQKMTISFIPADCRSNQVTVAGAQFSVQSPPGKLRVKVTGQVSAEGKLWVADAGAWDKLSALTESRGGDLPVVAGTIPLDTQREVYWHFKTLTGNSPDARAGPTPAQAFAAGLARAEAIGQRVQVDTPDPWLNAAVGVSGSVMDGVFRDGMFTHSGMRWGVPLLGWRTIYGGTAYGWHDRVKTQAALCLAKQIKESDKRTPKADAKNGYSCEGLDSRLFGKGRVDFHQPWHYDMQSQFFDQLIHAWRWTGDAELEKRLRPALELHLEYIKDCFDPDDDGIYESYANTWPTDDQWYNGGGTSEETAYAYQGHKAALDLARRAGDQQAAAFHQARLAKIQKGFFDLLWVQPRGHPGAYREQTGYRRLHESCWLYGIFCPIDAGLLSREQAAQSIHYTEWELERVRMPYGGQQCWPSTWVPSVWSLREMWPGDNYHLALACFQTGLASEGWELLRGTFPQMMFFGPVPGDLGFPNGGTDFNDCASMFCRTVVEGLFGYRPDYPNGLVTIAPQFPPTWNSATIQTPDFSLRFQRTNATTRLRVDLARRAPLLVQLPVSAKHIVGVKVNGAVSTWKLQPGFGVSLVEVRVSDGTSAEVEVTAAEPLPPPGAKTLAGNSGETIALAAQEGNIVECLDSQGVLSGLAIKKGNLTGTLTTNAGEHMVLARVAAGNTEHWQRFKITVTNVEAGRLQAAKVLPAVPAGVSWDCLDLTPALNGDTRAIFKQQYLSPRPATCSLRLAVDGCSTWQMALNPKNKPPEIDFAQVPKLRDGSGRLLTPQGVPFRWGDGTTNIAFTSQWDNWPRQLTFPVKRQGDALWFLICGFTSPMQVRIANAELRLKYADGVEEKLELVPPFSFWSLCAFGGADYNYQRDGACLPMEPPPIVQLGNNCRAMLLNLRLRSGVRLDQVTLETLSPETIVGLMGMSLMSR